MLHTRSFVLLIALFLAACGDGPSTGTTPDAGGDSAMPDTGDDCTAEIACADIECGADPVCGLDCGTCGEGEECETGMCVCVPDCDGRACGPDGCGGTCGTCTAGEECNEVSGTCDEICTPATCEDAGVECDATPDGCGGMLECGTCASGTCEAGVCTSTEPTFSFVEPSAPRAAQDSFDIVWTDDDPDSDAEIAFYWDDDDTGTDGTLIVDGISEDDETDLHTWDVSALPRGEYWIYAVMTDGITTTTVYAPAPVFVDTVTCAPPVMGKYSVDIATADVTLSVTLDGQAVDATNTNADDYGAVYLRREEGIYPLVPFWDGQNPRTSVDLTVPAGVYDVIYRPGVEDPQQWPKNSAVLAEGVEFADGADISLDIPTVEVTLDWTLNGSTYSGSASESASIRFLGNSGASFTSGANLPIDTTDTSPRTFRFVPDTFDVYYSAENTPHPPSTTLPINSGELGDVDFTTDTSATIDITTVDQSLDIELNGTPWATKLSSVASTNIVTLHLRPVCTGYCPPFSRIVVLDPSGPILPATFTMLPGDFSVSLNTRERNLHPELPAGGKIAESVAFTGSPITFSANSKTITLDFTLTGAPYTDLSDQPTARVYMIDPPYTSFAPESYFFDPAQMTVFESSYHAFFTFNRDNAGGAITPFPEADAGVFLEEFDATTSDAATIDIPVATLDVEARLAGTPISSSNITPDDRVFLNLWGQAQGSPYRANVWDRWWLAENPSMSTLSRPYHDGDISIEYVGLYRTGSEWPTANGWEVANLNLTSDQSIVVDVEGTPVEFVVTVDGVPVDPTGPVPEIQLRADVPDARFFNAFEPNAVGGWTPLQPRLFEATYDVGIVPNAFYENLAFFPVIVGCVEVPAP